MTGALAVYGSIPATEEEAQERARRVVRAHASPDEENEFLDALGLL